LRNKGWQTKEADKGPKTIAEIHEEAARAQAEKEAQNKASRAARPQGRGNDRSSSYYGNQHPPDWQANVKAQVDASELKKLSSKHRSMGTPATFGPASFLGPRPGARKPTMGRGGEDSGPNSRSGTPAPKESANKFR
jgi:translation initiation factor 4G